MRRSQSVSTGGACRSANASMSSEKMGENPIRRKPKGSQGRLVLLRSVGPKPRAIAVGDGHTVDIP